MRIIAGSLKGHSLFGPKNKNTRPLKDLTRESIFNLLIHSSKISLHFEESNILDLYSGTGSFGLECLSRYAKCVYFVENDKSAFGILEKNIEKLKAKNKTKIFFDNVFNIFKNESILRSKFNLIFCDPPFKDANVEKLIELIFNKNILYKSGIIILHRDKNIIEKFPKYFNILDERIYGRSKIIFGKFLL
jgi:16S rRNA (guanine966-N2)-methyltransferase